MVRSLARPASTCLLALLLGALMLSAAPAARAQGIEVEHRPISSIRIEGLDQVPEALVRNQIRLAPGQPYVGAVVQEDIVRITHLGRFASVAARVEPQDDGSVALVYVLAEQPLLADVQVVGNRHLSDQALLRRVQLRAGDPIDPFLVDRAQDEIRRAYQEEGFFATEVSLDAELLRESRILLLRVREGPRPRLRDIRFSGNTVFSDAQLKSRIRSREYFVIFRKGELNREQLDQDAARVRDFYRERGHLDAQVGRRIEVSPDERTAVVTFEIFEGREYVVERIEVEGNLLFTRQQIIETMTIKAGDPFSDQQLRRSEEAILDLYGKLGFIEARLERPGVPGSAGITRLFHDDRPRVDLVVNIVEGGPYSVGAVTVTGNEQTKQAVVLHHLRGLNPGRRFDRTRMVESERRLAETALFSEARLTLEGTADDPVRDVVVEVKEAGTGFVRFGAGVSSDAGLLGAIELEQRNFDLADWPGSFGEFITGRAFRGAGQYFALTLQPGVETSRYSVTFREPYLLDSDYFLDTTVFFFQRERRGHDEQRTGGSVAIGQRFGDVWTAAIRARGEAIDIRRVDADAAVDVLDVQGFSVLTSLGPVVSRDTTDSRAFPTRGSRWTTTLLQAGALGGDYDFTALDSEFVTYWTVDEDFFGRRSVLSWRLETGHILGGSAPLFERFYAGGHRSFRGFDFRGVSPRGRILNPDPPPATLPGDEPVGGDWLFLTSLEYNFPIFQEIIRMVIFTDSGTVARSVSFSDYRVSVGAGLRVRIPFLGEASFAIDFAYPIIKHRDDDVRYISFDLTAPF